MKRLLLLLLCVPCVFAVPEDMKYMNHDDMHMFGARAFDDIERFTGIEPECTCERQHVDHVTMDKLAIVEQKEQHFLDWVKAILTQ